MKKRSRLVTALLAVGLGLASAVGALVPAEALSTLTTRTPVVNDTTPKVGQTLTVTPNSSSYGGWGPATISFSYQWYKCTSTSQASCSAVGTATSSKTHYVSSTEWGYRLRVRVTGKKTGYTTAVRYSAMTSVTANGTITTATPTVSDTTPRVDQTVAVTPSTVSYGGWGPSPLTFSYQWYRCSPVSPYTCVTVGAPTTDRLHTVTAAEQGYQLKVGVTASRSKYTTVKKWSAATAKVAPSALVSAAQSLYGTFTAKTASGTGPSVVSLPTGARAGLITANSQGTFLEISTQDSANETLEGPVSASGGAYSGTTGFGLGLRVGEQPTKLAVDSDGPWTITIEPVSAAPQLPATTTTGTGNAVYLFSGAASTWGITYPGEGWLSVQQWLMWGEPAPDWNEVLFAYQPNSGLVAAKAGPGVLTVQSDGAWAIARAA